MSLAARDRVRGLNYHYRPHQRNVTASIVKVEILVALLLQAQSAGRPLSDQEQELATRMITISDNEAASEAWQRIGGAQGLAATSRRLGLRATGSAAEASWGVTQTSATDQVRILDALTRGSPLTAGHRRYVLGLMRQVIPEQRWGVSAAARDHETVALKNGWLPFSEHDGLWVVNTIGRIRGRHRDLLIAVLSDHSPALETGIHTVERVAEITAGRLT